MTDILTRQAAGRPLTHAELDQNFSNLNFGKAESATLTSALERVPTDLAASTTGLIASASNDGVPRLTSSNSQANDVINAQAQSLLNRLTWFIAQVASSTGSSLIGFIQNGIGAVKRTVQHKLLDTVSAKDFGAKGDGVTDDAAAVQAAIDHVYSTGGGEVLLPGIFGVATSVNLKAGVYLRGFAGSDYYAGMQFASDTNDSTFGSRIKALPTFPDSTPLVVLPVDAAGGVKRRRGRGAYNLILDAAGKAAHALYAVGDGTDCRTTFDNVSFQGAKSHNLYLAQFVAMTFNGCVSSACGGYGVYGAYGVSDSSFSEMYLHTNEQGGYFFGDGSLYVRINSGKCEDNYGAGIVVTQYGSTSTIVMVNGSTLQTNNSTNFVANGTNAQLFLYDVRSNNSASGNPGGASDAHCATAGGNMVVSGGYFDSSANYVFSASGGTITVSGDAMYDPAAVANTFTTAGGVIRNAGSVAGQTGKLPLRNRGGRKMLLSIAASTTGTATFSKVVENGLGASYFDSVGYRLTVLHAPYPTDGNSRVVAEYLVTLAGQGGAVASVGVVLLSGAPNAAYIAGVSATVNGTDITINLTTGASVGTGGQSTVFNISLQDIGQNMFGFDG